MERTIKIESGSRKCIQQVSYPANRIKCQITGSYFEADFYVISKIKCHYDIKIKCNYVTF